MQQTPLDRILSEIATSSQFITDEIYVFYILEKYGPMRVEQILDKSKSRSWQEPIPTILDRLKAKNLVEESDEQYEASSLEDLYKIIKDNVDLGFSDLKVLRDFI